MMPEKERSAGDITVEDVEVRMANAGFAIAIATPAPGPPEDLTSRKRIAYVAVAAAIVALIATRQS